MVIVGAKNLNKTYGTVRAVVDVSFEIKRGEIFGLLGPNGAGKTSTMNMLVGLSRPTSGHILIDGMDGIKNIKRAQSIMGIVPDESNLYDEMDGFENLCFCASLYGIPRSEREERANRLLRQFNLDDAGHRPYRTYSRGMRRRLTIAAGIIHDPKVLFLDEPTSGIDVESARQIRELILRLRDQGTGIFITTHYLEEAERVCDRIAFIVNGRIVKTGTVPEIKQDALPRHTIELIVEGDLETIKGDLENHFTGYKLEINNQRSCLIISKEPIPLYPILWFFQSKRISVYEAKEVKPSLEDVFVDITSR